MTENRVCQSCRVEKPLTEFRVRRIYKAGLTTYWPECNACLSADFPESVVIYSGPIVLRPEALAANLPRYFTGNPCDYGHIAQRMTSSKQCHACLSGLTKVRDKTPEHKAKKNTRRNAKRAENLEAERAKDRAYAALHADENAAAQRRYRKEQPDRVRASKKKTYVKTLDKILARNRERRAREFAAEGTHSASDIADIRKMQKDRCANPACRIKLHGKGHVDHRVPLSKGGSNDRKNLQLLCASCNGSEQAKDELIFMQELGFLL